MPQPSQAGPVLCTTTLEAPLVQAGQPLPARSGPTEVTRCGVVGTVPELVEQRYFSYRSSFARGVGITHQITDFFGLAMGGSDGNRLMGFGFPDQAIIWDGSAIENTTTFLMDQQVHLVPRRTADLPTAFTTSVGSGSRLGGDGDSAPLAYPAKGFDPR
ncbi:MAG: Occludin/ELL family protein [Cyanobium sp.]